MKRRILCVLAIACMIALAVPVTASAMQVHVELQSGKVIPLEVESGASVDNVKQKVQGEVGIPVHQQRLVFEGVTLETGRTLADYNVQKESKLLVAPPVYYLDALGGRKSLTSFKAVRSSDDYWGVSGEACWYVAEGDVTIDRRVAVRGNVHLVLVDGCRLAVNGGIGIGASDGSLTVYAQSAAGDAVGKLVAQGDESHAGIGGNYNGSGGSITINGGDIDAVGGKNGAGIGSGYNGTSAGSLTVNGGDVSATGGWYAAGIGCGNNGSWGNIAINGGKVDARSTTQAGSTQGPGIGCDSDKSCGAITISGGAVFADGGKADGIGLASSAQGGTCGDIAIGGGAVVRVNKISDKWNRAGSSSIVFVGNCGTVYGSDVVPSADFEVRSDETLTVPSSCMLTINKGRTASVSSGATVTNDGVIRIMQGGKLDNSGVVSGSHAYAISLENVDGVDLGETPQVTYGAEVSLPAGLERVGYAFAGWYDGDNEVTSIVNGSTGDLRLTAKWKANTYTVRFDANGGEGDMADQAFTYDATQALSANAFMRAGYTFAGWKDEGTGKTYEDEEEVSNLTAVSSATVTLTAQWDAIPVHHHSVAVVPAKAATCTETGLTEGEKCSSCGAVVKKQEIIPALGHEWGKWVVSTPATLETTGVETSACMRDGCEIAQVRAIPRLTSKTVASKGVTYVCDGKQAVATDVSKKLGKLVIPDKIAIDGIRYPVTGIAPYAFEGCKKLESIVLGAGVKSIGKSVFKGDKKLKTITVTSKHLSKKQVKNCLKGSSVTKVIVKVGSAKANKSYAKKYKPLFKKGVCGKKGVSVKASKKALKK